MGSHGNRVRSRTEALQASDLGALQCSSTNEMSETDSNAFRAELTSSNVKISYPEASRRAATRRMLASSPIIMIRLGNVSHEGIKLRGKLTTGTSFCIGNSARRAGRKKLGVSRCLGRAASPKSRSQFT